MSESIEAKKPESRINSEWERLLYIPLRRARGADRERLHVQQERSGANMELSQEEKRLIISYRQKPRDVQELILRGLGVEHKKKILKFENKEPRTDREQGKR